MKMKQFFPIKLTAWALSLFMLLSSMGDGGILYAAQSPVLYKPSAQFNLNELQVPEKFGEVSEKSEGENNKPAVILIQDAHAIPDAQKNIHALIRHFEKKYGVKNVALEGASSELDPQFFRSFPDQKLLKKIFKDYYERAELSGAAAASVFAETDVRFQGVEDWPLYEQALLDYLRALESETLVLASLKELKLDLNSSKQKNYSTDLLKADRAWEAFEENQTQILETIKVLASIKNPAAGSLIELLMRVEPQGETGQGQDTELKAAVEVVRAGLDKNPAAQKKELMELNRCLQAYQTGEMNAQEFAVRIKKLAEGLSLALQFSRPLRELSAMQMRLESMRGTKLLKEFEAYAADIKRELVERETDLPRKEAIRVTEKQSQKIRLIEKLARLELSHDEWNQIQSIRRSSPEGEEGEPRLIDWNLLEANLSFYENSVEREKAFMRNVRKLLPKPTSDTRPVILVAGGFHTQGMAERFKKEGLSYAVVTPKIERLPEVNSYRKHMAGDVSWKSYFKFEGNRVRPYDAFARSVRDQLLSQDLDAAKVWRDEIIRDLADQGRAQDAWKYTKFIDETQSRDGRRNRSPREGVAERLSRRVDQFVSGLRSLNSSGKLNQSSVAQLLKSMSAAEAVLVNAFAPEASVLFPAAKSVAPQSIPQRPQSALEVQPARETQAATDDQLGRKTSEPNPDILFETESVFNALKARLKEEGLADKLDEAFIAKQQDLRGQIFAALDGQKFPIVEWAFNGIRPAASEGTILSDVDLIPSASLAYPFSDSLILSSGNPGTNSRGVYFNFLKTAEGKNVPAAIKIFSQAVSGVERNEILQAQLFGLLGISPLFLGMIRLADGSVGYAMEPVWIAKQDADFEGGNDIDRDEITLRTMIAGMGPPSLVVTNSGNLVAIDAGNASPLENGGKIFKHFVADYPKAYADLFRTQKRNENGFPGVKRSEMRTAQGESAGMRLLVDGESVIYQPQSNRMDWSLVRPYDNAATVQFKIDNEIARFENVAGLVFLPQADQAGFQQEARAIQNRIKLWLRQSQGKHRAEYLLSKIHDQIISKTIFSKISQSRRNDLAALVGELIYRVKNSEAYFYLGETDEESQKKIKMELFDLEKKRLMVRVFKLLLEMPYGFRTEDKGTQLMQRELLEQRKTFFISLYREIEKSLKSNTSAEKIVGDLIASKTQKRIDTFNKQIVADEEKLNVLKLSNPASDEVRVLEVSLLMKKQNRDKSIELRSYLESLKDSLDHYDFVFDESDVESDRQIKIDAEERLHSQIMTELSDYSFDESLREAFDATIRDEIKKGRTLGYAAAKYLYSLYSFDPNNGQELLADNDFLGFMMRYYYEAVYGVKSRTQQLQDKPIVVFTDTPIANETQYQNLLNSMEGHGRIVAIVVTKSKNQDGSNLRYPHWFSFAKQEGIVPILNLDLSGKLEDFVQGGEITWVDGLTGEVYHQPDSQTTDELTHRRDSYFYLNHYFNSKAKQPAQVAGRDFPFLYDTAQIDYFLSAEDSEPSIADEKGGSGVGLFRMEKLMGEAGRDALEGDEDRLKNALLEFVTSPYFSDRPGSPLIIRLFDVQDDKRPRFLLEGRTPEEVEAIVEGYANIRFYLGDVNDPAFREFRSFGKRQIRAIMIAALRQPHPEMVKILFPNVLTTEEVLLLEGLIQDAEKELVENREEALDPLSEEELKIIRSIPVGYMVEDTRLASKVDAFASSIKILEKTSGRKRFLAVGTNDLLKSVLRDYPGSGERDQMHPQMINDLHRIILAANQNELEITIEGEWASKPQMLLVAAHAMIANNSRFRLVPFPEQVPYLKALLRELDAADFSIALKYDGAGKKKSLNRALQDAEQGLITSADLHDVLLGVVKMLERRITEGPDFKKFVQREKSRQQGRSEMRGTVRDALAHLAPKVLKSLAIASVLGMVSISELRAAEPNAQTYRLSTGELRTDVSNRSEARVGPDGLTERQKSKIQRRAWLWAWSSMILTALILAVLARMYSLSIQLPPIEAQAAPAQSQVYVYDRADPEKSAYLFDSKLNLPRFQYLLTQDEPGSQSKNLLKKYFKSADAVKRAQFLDTWLEKNWSKIQPGIDPFMLYAQGDSKREMRHPSLQKALWIIRQLDPALYLKIKERKIQIVESDRLEGYILGAAMGTKWLQSRASHDAPPIIFMTPALLNHSAVLSTIIMEHEGTHAVGMPMSGWELFTERLSEVGDVAGLLAGNIPLEEQRAYQRETQFLMKFLGVSPHASQPYMANDLEIRTGYSFHTFKSALDSFLIWGLSIGFVGVVVWWGTYFRQRSKTLFPPASKPAPKILTEEEQRRAFGLKRRGKSKPNKRRSEAREIPADVYESMRQEWLGSLKDGAWLHFRDQIKAVKHFSNSEAPLTGQRFLKEIEIDSAIQMIGEDDAVYLTLTNYSEGQDSLVAHQLQRTILVVKKSALQNLVDAKTGEFRSLSLYDDRTDSDRSILARFSWGDIWTKRGGRILREPKLSWTSDLTTGYQSGKTALAYMNFLKEKYAPLNAIYEVTISNRGVEDYLLRAFPAAQAYYDEEFKDRTQLLDEKAINQLLAEKRESEIPTHRYVFRMGRSEARKLDWNDDSSAMSDRLNQFVAQIKRSKIQWLQANHPQSLLSFDVEAGASMELTNHGPESHRATRLPGQLIMVRPGNKILNDKDFAPLEKEPTHTLRRAQGALGWVRVSEMTLDGEPILYINEVQSSAGFHALWKRFKGDKNNLRWAAAAVESITQAAQASGYKIIVAKNHRTARLENPNRPGSDKTWQLISDGALQEVYKRPFKGWDEIDIEHSTGWKTNAWMKELNEPLPLVQPQSQLTRWWSEMLAKLRPFWFTAQVNRGPAPAVTENNVAVSLDDAQERQFLDESVVQAMRAAISNKKNLNQIFGGRKLGIPVKKTGVKLRLKETFFGLGAFEIEMKSPGQEDWVTLPMSRLNFKEKSDEIILDDIAIDNEFKFVGQGMGSTIFAYLYEYARLTQKSIRIPSTENYWLGFAIYKHWGQDATYEAQDRSRQPLREVYANPPKEIIVEIHAPVRERPVFKYQNGAYVRQWEAWMESGDTLSPKLELSWDTERLVLKNPIADARFSESQYSMYWPQSVVNIVIQPQATVERSDSRAGPEAQQEPGLMPASQRSEMRSFDEIQKDEGYKEWVRLSRKNFLSERDYIKKDKSLDWKAKSEALKTVGDKYIRESYEEMKRAYDLVDWVEDGSQDGKVVSPFALAAVGTYGRNEMSYISDYDLKIIYSEGDIKEFEAPFQFLFYSVLNIVGTTPSPLAVEQISISQELDAQLISEIVHPEMLAGSRRVFSDLQFRWTSAREEKSFRDGAMRALIKLWQDGRERTNFFDGLFEREPDIKKGAGGLYDFENALSMIFVVFGDIEFAQKAKQLTTEEWNEAKKAQEFLLKARMALNQAEFEQGKKSYSNKLSVSIRGHVADLMGYRDEPGQSPKEEQFFTDYRQATETIFLFNNQIFRRAFHYSGSIKEYKNKKSDLVVDGVVLMNVQYEERTGETILLDKGLMSVNEEKILTVVPNRNIDPAQIPLIFLYAAQNGYHLTGELMDEIVRNRRTFKELLKKKDYKNQAAQVVNRILGLNGEISYVLTRMQAFGLLGDIWPEYSELDSRELNDIKHDKTLGWYSISTISRIEEPFELAGVKSENIAESTYPMLATALQDVKSRNLLLPLRAALLVQAIAEAQPRAARGLIRTLELNDRDREVVTWLVENKDAMFNLLRSQGHQSYLELSRFQNDVVGNDYEKWLLLLVATNIRVSLTSKARQAIYQERLNDIAGFDEAGFKDPEKVKAQIESWNSNVLSLLNGSEMEEQQIAVHQLSLKESKLHQFIISVPTNWNSPGVLEVFSGALTSAGLNIHVMDIGKSEKGMLRDRFIVTGNVSDWGAETLKIQSKITEAFKKIKVMKDSQLSEDQRQKQHDEIIDALFSGFKSKRELGLLHKTGKDVTKIHIRNEDDSSSSYLELETPDRPGIIYVVARVLRRHGVAILPRTTGDMIGYDPKVGMLAVDTFEIQKEGNPLSAAESKWIQEDLNFIFGQEVIANQTFQEMPSVNRDQFRVSQIVKVAEKAQELFRGWEQENGAQSINLKFPVMLWREVFPELAELYFDEVPQDYTEVIHLLEGMGVFPKGYSAQFQETLEFFRQAVIGQSKDDHFYPGLLESAAETSTGSRDALPAKYIVNAASGWMRLAGTEKKWEQDILVYLGDAKERFEKTRKFVAENDQNELYLFNQRFMRSFFLWKYYEQNQIAIAMVRFMVDGLVAETVMQNTLEIETLSHKFNIRAIINQNEGNAITYQLALGNDKEVESTEDVRLLLENWADWLGRQSDPFVAAQNLNLESHLLGQVKSVLAKVDGANSKDLDVLRRGFTDFLEQNIPKSSAARIFDQIGLLKILLPVMPSLHRIYDEYQMGAVKLHSYSVAAHTFYILEVLDRLSFSKEERFATFRKVYENIQRSRSDLLGVVLGILLHDSGKQFPSAWNYMMSHQMRGALQIVPAMLAPFNLDPQTLAIAEDIAWYHQHLNEMGRDLASGRVVMEQAVLQWIDHPGLNLQQWDILYLVSVGDYLGLGREKIAESENYEAFRLVGELYKNVRHYLEAPEDDKPALRERIHNKYHKMQLEFRASLQEEFIKAVGVKYQEKGVVEQDFKLRVNEFVELYPIAYLRKTDRHQLLEYFDFFMKLVRNEVSSPQVLFRTYRRADMQFLETIVGDSQDRPEFVDFVTSVIAAYRLSVHEANIQTSLTGAVLDHLQLIVPPEHELTVADLKVALEKDIKRVLAGEITLADIYKKETVDIGDGKTYERQGIQSFPLARWQEADARPVIRTYLRFQKPKTYNDRTILILETADRVGLLHAITRVISEGFGLNILPGPISTHKSGVRNLIYLSTADQKPIDDEKLQGNVALVLQKLLNQVNPTTADLDAAIQKAKAMRSELREKTTPDMSFPEAGELASAINALKKGAVVSAEQQKILLQLAVAESRAWLVERIKKFIGESKLAEVVQLARERGVSESELLLSPEFCKGQCGESVYDLRDRLYSLFDSSVEIGAFQASDIFQQKYAHGFLIVRFPSVENQPQKMYLLDLTFSQFAIKQDGQSQSVDESLTRFAPQFREELLRNGYVELAPKELTAYGNAFRAAVQLSLWNDTSLNTESIMKQKRDFFSKPMHHVAPDPTPELIRLQEEYLQQINFSVESAWRSERFKAARSETRAIDIEKAEKQFRLVVEAAGFKYQQESMVMTQKGINKATPYRDNYFTASSLPIPKEAKRVKIVDAGSGQGWAVLRMAHMLEQMYPDIEFEFVGIEFEENLVQEAEQILKKAIENEFIGEKSKISFVQGDFTHTEFSVDFNSADFVYYFSDGSKNVGRLANVLTHNLRPGSHVIEYPYGDLDGAMKDAGGILFDKEPVYHPDEVVAAGTSKKAVPVFHLYKVTSSAMKKKGSGEVNAVPAESPTELVRVGFTVITAQSGEKFEVEHTRFNNRHALVINHNGQQVGYAHFVIDTKKGEAVMDSAHSPDFKTGSDIVPIWVNPNYKGKYLGIDRSLMAQAFQIAQGENLRGFRVPRSLDDEFYRSVGMLDFLQNGDFWIPLEPDQMQGWKISIPEIKIELRTSTPASPPTKVDSAKRAEGREAIDRAISTDALLDSLQEEVLSVSPDEVEPRARVIVRDVEAVGLEDYLAAVQKLRDEMVAGLEGEHKIQMQNLVRFFADAILQNSKSEIEIALDAPELEIALQQAIQKFAFGDGVRFVLPKTMANLKVPATMVRRVNSLVSAVKKGAPVLLSIFSAGGEGASQKSESIVDLISDEDGLADFNDVQRQKADVLMRMLVAILLSGKVKSRDQMNNIPMLLTDAGYFQNIVQALTFKDGRLAVSMNVLMRLAQEYAATKQIQAAA